MRSNAAIRPLPFGSKLKQTKKENFKNLLIANNDDNLEATFWQQSLDDLETKYELIYRHGKDLFQIYYHAGKNDNANKAILNEISQRVKATTEQWKKITDTFASFIVFRDDFLYDVYGTINKDLKKIEEDKNEYLNSLPQPIDPESKEVTEYFKKYTGQRDVVQKHFMENEQVKKVDALQKEYMKQRDEILKTYLESKNKDFDKLLSELEFKK